MKRTDILRALVPERTKRIHLRGRFCVNPTCLKTRTKSLCWHECSKTKVLLRSSQHVRDWSWKVLGNRCYEFIRQQKYKAALLDESILELVDAELEQRDTADMPARVDALLVH